MKKTTIALTLAFATLAIFYACNEEYPTIENALSNKIELTLTQNSVTGVSVDLTCNVTNPDKISISEYGLCWNTSGNPTTSDFKTDSGALSGTSFNENIESYNSNLTELVPNTLYYVRAYATNKNGTGYRIRYL